MYHALAVGRGAWGVMINLQYAKFTFCLHDKEVLPAVTHRGMVVPVRKF